MKKIKLYIVPGFGTNAEMLKECCTVFSECMSVEVIEMPGLHKDLPAFKKITIDNYQKYLSDYLKNINEPYVISGLSLGYLLLNDLPLNRYCLGVIAFLPYLGNRSLKITKPELMITRGLTVILSNRSIANKLWYSRFFHKRELKFLSEDQMAIRKKHIDPATYIKLGGELLKVGSIKPRNDLPCVLIYSVNDEALNYKYIKEEFTHNVENIKIIETKISHYPKNLNITELKRSLPDEKINELYEFLINTNNSALIC